MKKFALLLILMILLAGCYKTTLTQVRLGDWGYQFLEPEGICRKQSLPNGIEIYCPEGRITITFPMQSEVGSVEEVMAETVGEDAQLYTISEWEALGPALTVAELPLKTHMEDESRPKYIAAKPFGAERMAVIEGLLYSGAFEAEFDRTFRTVTTQLRPTDLQEAGEDEG